MRVVLSMLISMFTLTAGAQTHLSVPAVPYASSQPLWLSPSFGWSPTSMSFDYSTRRWQLKPYAAISTGFLFWNGGGGSYLSAPVGLMLIRPLTNNLAAFSTLSVAPTIFSSMYHGPGINSSPYDLRLNPRIEGGLMYTNDARTFSISGSVSVERGGYLTNPALSHPKNYPKSY